MGGLFWRFELSRHKMTCLDSAKKFIRLGHIPLLVFLQIFFIILFAAFVEYDPISAVYNETLKTEHTLNSEATRILNVYPAFQDVHVMIFVGFGFLMTFLKKYGLAAVSLNMLLSVLCIEWSILVNGFLHLHYDKCEVPEALARAARSAGGGGAEELRYNKFCNDQWPWIDITLGTMLSADFATAAVLISFGVLLGTTTPIQLILMSLIEIVLFNINEVIGRNYIGAVD